MKFNLSASHLKHEISYICIEDKQELQKGLQYLAWFTLQFEKGSLLSLELSILFLACECQSVIILIVIIT